MKNTKKLSAALLVVVMLISMLSCMVVPSVSAAGSTLGEPLSIDANVSAGSGIAVGGKALPNDILVVCSSWAGLSGKVSVKLGDVVYGATMGANAFAEIADASAAANAGNTIYVAAGIYTKQIDVKVSGLKIYGPYAGVCPNAPFNGAAVNLATPNPARPAAASLSAETKREAIISGTVYIPKEGPHTTIDGVYFEGAAKLQNQSGALRYGTYIKNCIINVTGGTFFDTDRGMNANVVVEDNRVLNAKTLITMGGVMDIRVSRNYLNQSNVTARPSSFASGAMGTSCIIEDNYYAVCNGAIAYDRSGPYQIVLYSFFVRNNYVAKCGPNYPFVTNKYFAMNSLPGITMNITGNTIMGVDPNKAVLEFPYVASQGNPGTYRYTVNFNNNKVDLPAAGTLVNSGMNGVLNCAYNYYTNGISLSQIVKHSEADLILYPYYADEEMTTLVGDARITKVNLSYPNEIDQENLVVNIDMTNTPYDTVNMGAALTVSEGCTWELYEDETLNKKVKNKTLYFDGVETVRYAAIYTPDGILSNIYTVIVEREYGSEAKIVDVLVNNSTVPAPEILGTAYIFDVPSNVPFLDYEIKTSSGATYTLYSDMAMTTELEADSNYIPYGGYTVYVKLKSEDNTMDGAASITFNRDRSDVYDPCVEEVTAPAGGTTIVRPDRMDATKLWMIYTPDRLLKTVNFDFKTTPGATWKLYKESAKTTLLSSSAAKKELALNPGINTLYLEVSDATNSVLLTFVVQNQTLSSDAVITGLVGFAPTIVNNTIYVAGFGETFMANFTTSNPYAVCEVYGDAAKKYPVAYTSNPVTDPETNRTTESRTFNLDINLLGESVYYVDCVAEDGSYNTYTMKISKTITPIEFNDVSAETWYYEYVKEAANAGILQGDQNQNYNPGYATTRQEMATVAARLLGYNNEAYANVKLNMKDEAKIAGWALGAVKVCYANGVMKGNSENDGVYFMPENSVTRQEVMVMFARMFNLSGSYDLSVFPDADAVASWAKAEVEATVASGLVNGSDGMLKPNAPISRAELAALIARAK